MSARRVGRGAALWTCRDLCVRRCCGAQGYFGEDFEEGIVRDNFTLVYELLDEILDFGYPQTSSLEVLQAYINLGSQKKLKNINTHADLSSMITGALDWRREGIRYRKNEVRGDACVLVRFSSVCGGGELQLRDAPHVAISHVVRRSPCDAAANLSRTPTRRCSSTCWSRSTS